MIECLRSVDQWMEFRDRHRTQSVGLIPTMGNLHNGHVGLVDKVSLMVDLPVVSIFVNPTQFSPQEDFDTYPRTLEKDCAILEKNTACAAVFVPTIETVYHSAYKDSERFLLENHETVAPLALVLCGVSRPHFFFGVVEVVSRLFAIIEPQVACFGEKDYQQLLIIQKITEQVFPNIKIVSIPTIREPDGLAMSSRNRYLSTVERVKAASLYRHLLKMKLQIRACHRAKDIQKILDESASILGQIGLDLDYLQLRDGRSLRQVQTCENSRLFAACFLGKTRMIDNVSL